MTVQLEYINYLEQFFKNISYYAGIMLDPFSDLLCSKLCWHNRLVPSVDMYMCLLNNYIVIHVLYVTAAYILLLSLYL